MDFKDIRRKVGEAIIGEPLRDSARILGGFQLASFRNENDSANLVHAQKVVDEFWRRDRNKIPKVWLQQFMEMLEADPFMYARIYALSANHNRLVNDGTRLINKYLTGIATNSAAGAAIGTLPTFLQLGTNATGVHLPTYTGCVTPITSPSTMVEAAATVTQVTTDANYTFDTIQLQKTNFVNNSGGGVVVTVNEIAMRNGDATKICFCRTATNSTPVADTGTLNATYKLQVQP